MRKNNIQALAESGLLIALSIGLSLVYQYVPFLNLPQGGTIMPFALVPLVIIGLRWGSGWGIGASLTFGVIDMIFGLENFSYVTGIWALIGVALLDYIIAFGAYGLSPLIAKPFKSNKIVAYGMAGLVTGLLQFVCSFISGIVIWEAYAPEDTPVWIYSLTYNATFGIPNAVLTMIGTVAAMALLDKAFPVRREIAVQ